MKGWRYEIAGQALSALLAGETRISINDGRLSLSPT